jgi:twitching motility protein PilU
MEFRDYLQIMVHHHGSDIYLTTGAPPCVKVHGILRLLDKEPLPPGRTKEIAYQLLSEEQTAEFERRPEMNIAISAPGAGRFRVNIFKQRNEVALVVHNITTEIPQLKDLGVPPVLAKVIISKRGLILFAGASGSGKSTSLAALIDFRNSHSAGHIITIEDPIEFLHPYKKCLVNQREVGVDTDSYEDALKSTWRQAPDVIFIDEVRDQYSMGQALAFADTGHLCLSTLLANNATQALDHIINLFPEERRHQVLLDLSLNLRALVSQRLVPAVDGKRVAAVEVLLGTHTARDHIARGDLADLPEIMDKSEADGMQTFDNSSSTRPGELP